jgi:uncharacterized membrane protein
MIYDFLVDLFFKIGAFTLAIFLLYIYRLDKLR